MWRLIFKFYWFIHARVIEKEEKFLWLVSLCPNIFFFFIFIAIETHTTWSQEEGEKQDYYLEFLLLVLSHVSSLTRKIILIKMKFFNSYIFDWKHIKIGQTKNVLQNSIRKLLTIVIVILLHSKLQFNFSKVWWELNEWFNGMRIEINSIKTKTLNHKFYC